MKKMICCFATVLLLGSLSQASAQEVSGQLAQIKEKVERILSEKMPEWKHSSITPITGSNNVIVDQWSLGNKVVKISIMEHASQEEAAETMRRFAAGGNPGSRVENLGDEAYTSGIRGAIAFRKDNRMVYISTVATNVNEEAALCKGFAQHVASVLQDF